jgi:hypothetical protein
MLPLMNARRFAAAVAVVLSAALVGSSCTGPAIPDCGFPTLSETAADGGPDPCHCDPPPSLDIQACPCFSGQQGDVDLYNGCMALYRTEMMDAGAD